MPRPTELLRAMEPDRFNDVLAASPKQFREELFRKAGIRAKGQAFALAAHNKTRQRADKLLSSLKNGRELDESLCEEVIRNYLYTRRELLADALTHFGVPHDNGLTDEDLSFIDTLPAEKCAELRQLLEAKHDQFDVSLYMHFMGVGARQ